MRLYYGDVGDLAIPSLSVWAGSDRTIGANTSTTLSGHVLDEGTATPDAVCSWVQAGGPSGAGMAQFESASRADTTVTLPVVGTYVLRLGARTPSGAVAWDDVTITVE